MKKSVLMITAAAACVAACGFGACSCKKSGNSGYDKLNDMLNANYSQIALTVTDTFDDESTLISEYIIKYSESEITVEYTVERFSSLSLDGTSDSFKTVLTGTAVIKDGSVTGGEEVGITASIANPKLNFKSSYFGQAYLTDTSLLAEVKEPSAFLGIAVSSCTDMKVNAKFSDVFSDIKVIYTQNGNKVEYKYVFTK